MATVRELIPRAQLPGSPSGYRGSWYALFCKPIPTHITDDAFVIIPDIDIEAKWQVRWNPQDAGLPVEGSEALVIFDSKSNLWVVQWQ